MPDHQYQFTIKPHKSRFSDIQKQDTGIKCPKCKKGTLTHLQMKMLKGGQYIPIDFYSCSNQHCHFSASGKMSGLKITPEILKQIIAGTLPVQTLHSARKGTDFKARLVYYRGKICYKFPPRKVHYDKVFDFKCPKCHKGKIALKTGKSKRTGKPYAGYVCTNQKCNFYQNRLTSGVKLTPSMIKKACQGKLNEMQFTSKKGKPFQATLAYSRGRLNFEFSDNK